MRRNTPERDFFSLKYLKSYLNGISMHSEFIGWYTASVHNAAYILQRFLRGAMPWQQVTILHPADQFVLNEHNLRQSVQQCNRIPAF